METTDFRGKKALIRVDFNVPFNEAMEVVDDTRIRAAIPTIQRVIEQGGVPILMSHLGRPSDGYEAKYSLKNITSQLHQLTGAEIVFAEDCIGEVAKQACLKSKHGQIVLLENLRFHPEEKKGDKGFAKALSDLGDIYINDAFGTAHRAHASTTIVAQFFPEIKMFGYLMLKELENLNKVLKSPEKPITAILGGAKIAGKIEVIKQLMNLVDHIIIGGGMSYTFIKALGGEIGGSLVDHEKIEVALDIIERAKNTGVTLHLPVDSIICQEFSNEMAIQTVAIDSIPEGWLGLDIGAETIKLYEEVVANSQTIVWNGPMGVFEMSNFEMGSKAIATAIAAATSKGAFSLIGGGDSVSAINQFGLADQVSYVSTGGGALLEFMEGKSLPGVEAISN